MLSSTDTAKQTAAAAHWLALLKQSYHDETDGTSPWRATPFWGRGSENPARELRRWLLNKFNDKAPAGSVPLIEWLVFHQPQPDTQAHAMRSLNTVTTDAADALRLKVIAAQPDNIWVLALALEQAHKRKLAVDNATLTAFAKHHRASLRKVAAVWLKSNGQPVPAFDATAAVQSAAVKKVIDGVLALWPDLPAADAKPLFYHESYFRNDNTIYDHDPELCWIVKETKDHLTLLHLEGREHSHRLSERNGKPTMPGTSTWRTEPANLETEVAAIAKLRDKGDPEFGLSSHGGLTGQFEGHGPSLKELLLDIWLSKAGYHELASRILLLAIDAAPTDADVIDTAKHLLAIVYGQRMLNAFAFNRDFTYALSLAKLTTEKYPETEYSEHAQRLVRELPLRGDDFTKLALPTAADWAKQKPKLTREQQIDFLCERLRLLNCFQWGQPGGVSYSDKQYAEPRLPTRESDFRDDKDRTAVINPLSELEGSSGTLFNGDVVEGLVLTVADIPVLAKHLKHDWTMVMYSYWRDFHPGRTLHPTRKVLSGIIQSLAKQDLADVDEIQKMTPQQIEDHIAKIAKWAREHLQATEGDLHLDALEKAVATHQWWWQGPEDNALEMIRLKDHRVLKPVLKYLEHPDVDKRVLNDVLLKVAPFDPLAFQKPARLALILPEQDSRELFQAALILLAAGVPEPPYEQLTTLLAGESSLNIQYALEVLSEKDDPRARKLIKQMFALKWPRDLKTKERKAIIIKLGHQYATDILKFYEVMLDDSSAVDTFNKDRLVKDIYAEEIFSLLREDEAKVEAIAASPGTPREKIPAIKKWIAEELKAK
ncbi:hypothetical protein BH11PLA2_BH11PLA2_48580 [soil metagenome]